MEKFAYDNNSIGGCECPAVRAGYYPGSGDGTKKPAEWYDIAVHDLGYDNANSTLTEEEAKEAWLTMISQLKASYGEDCVKAKPAIEVAEELGWLSEDEE